MPDLQAAFVFTDIESSTRLWLDSPDEALTILGLHDDLIREAFEEYGGEVIKNTGDGVLALFDESDSALRGVVEAQRLLADHADELGIASSVRMGVHLGRATATPGDLYGLDIHKAQRVMSVARGGQVVVSEAAAKSLLNKLPSDVGLVDLGRMRLKGLDSPERIFQVIGESLGAEAVVSTELGSAHSNLPEDVSSFVGRQKELAALSSLLSRSRLLTLIGEGGSGKTRLARELVRSAGGRFLDGTWWVGLSRVSDPKQVLRTTSSLLQAPPSVDSTAALGDYLEHREVLLAFDGCERTLETTAELTSELLRRSPASKVVATSRSRLDIGGEALFRVPPMLVPTAQVDVDEALRFDATALFAARAEASNPEFVVDGRNIDSVVEICRKLDGLPLAVEVAAARVSSMTPKEIATRLQTPHERLSGVEIALSWSLDLLSNSERDAFELTSIFRSPFDESAAAAILEIDDAIPRLVSLVEKSLLRRTATGRFQALRPVREYGRRLLRQRPDGADVGRRHSHHFGAVTDSAGSEWEGPAMQRWLDLLWEVADDLRRAHDQAISDGDGLLALRLALGSAPLWKQRGLAAEGIERLEQSVGLGGPPDLISAAYFHVGDLCVDVGEFEVAAENLEKAASISAGLDNQRQLARALARKASIPHKLGDIPAATAAFERALDASRLAGDDNVLSHVLASLALLENDQGRLQRASGLAEEAVSAASRTGDPYAQSDALLTAGEMALNVGDAETALMRFREAKKKAEEVGLGDVLAWSLSYLGRAALIDGDGRAAMSFLEEGIEVFETTGTALGRPWALRHLAVARWRVGETAEALRLLDEAMAEALQLVKPEALMIAEAKAWVLAENDPLAAAAILGATASISASMGLVYPGWEATQRADAIAQVSAQIGAAELRTAFESGVGLGLDRL